MNFNQMAEKACHYIVAGFVGNPQKTETEIVDLIKFDIPDLVEVKGEIDKYRPTIKTMADNILTASAEVDDEESQKFSLYFNKIFDMFIA